MTVVDATCICMWPHFAKLEIAKINYECVYRLFYINIRGAIEKFVDKRKEINTSLWISLKRTSLYKAIFMAKTDFL